MNILVLNWKDIKNPTAGGAELVTYEHAKRWVKKGHKVTWLSSSFKSSKKIENLDGIEIVRFGNIYGVYIYAPYFYLFGGRKFDLVVDEVHGIPFFTPFYVRKPILVLIHEIAGEIWDYMYGFPFNYIGKFLEKFYLKLYSSRKFWVVSNSTKIELVNYGIKPQNIDVIFNGISTPVLNSLPRKYKNLTFIFVSRIVKMKGIENVINAFQLILNKNPKARLLIVGGGNSDYIGFLKNKISKEKFMSKSVSFLGFINESKKLEIISKSHLLLHASVKEGWGLVVVEAASQGTPSVVYNVQGLSESVLNGKTGIVLKKNTYDEMAKEAFNLYMQKKHSKRYQSNCLKYAKSLSWEKSGKLSVNLIEKMMVKK